MLVFGNFTQDMPDATRRISLVPASIPPSFVVIVASNKTRGLRPVSVVSYLDHDAVRYGAVWGGYAPTDLAEPRSSAPLP